MIVVIVAAAAAADDDVGEDGETDEESLQLHIHSLSDDAWCRS